MNEHRRRRNNTPPTCGPFSGIAIFEVPDPGVIFNLSEDIAGLPLTSEAPPHSEDGEPEPFPL